MAVITSAGRTLAATAIQTNGAQVAITFVGIGTGCGTLASAVTSGAPITSLPLDAGLPAGLTAGTTLTVTDGTHSETVTVSAPGAVTNATSIPINSWTPLNSYVAHVTGVAAQQQASDIALYNETVRIAAQPGGPGANPGESLNNGYFDGSQATGIYLIVGYFGGATATSTPGTGTMLAEDIQYWNHVLNADSASFQLDNTL